MGEPPAIQIADASPSDRTIAAAPSAIALFAGTPQGAPAEPALIQNRVAYEQEFAGSGDADLDAAVSSYFINGGGAAWIVRAAALDAPGIGAALDAVDSFNLLAIPGLRSLAEDAHIATAAAAAERCRQRRAMLLLDLPATVDSVAAAVGWAEARPAQLGQARSFAAAYWPEPLLAEGGRPVAPSGIIAAIYAQADARSGPWQAPAGTGFAIAGVDRLSVELSDATNGRINPLGLNALRTFPVHGIVPWGARTLAGADALASDWKYVPVRRLALLIENSLYRGLQWTVFEPNDETLWAAVRQSVSNFMYALWRQGAMRGSTPRDAWFARCDSATTMQADIDVGRLNLVVGFAPLKPAEFVVLKFQLTAAEPD